MQRDDIAESSAAGARRSQDGGDGAPSSAPGQIPSMAYCHQCAIEIRPMVSPSGVYTCPRCDGEFVEIIESEQDRPQDFDPVGQAPLHTYDPGLGPAHNILNALLAGLGGATIGGAANFGSTTGGAAARLRRADRPSPSLNTSAQGNVRGGSASFGPVNVQWRLSGSPSPSALQNDPTPERADAPSTRRRANSDTRATPTNEWRPLNGGPPGVESRESGEVPTLATFLQRAFGERPETAQPTRSDFDDGMGGSGAAGDGRFFNHDNQGTFGHDNGGPQAANNPEDQFEPLRNLFSDLFTGMRPAEGRPAARTFQFGGTAAAGAGPASLLLNLFGGQQLRANVGDYAWGEAGLDNIITQLMEQAAQAGQGNAPPPAPEDAINKLERFKIADLASNKKAKNDECPTCKEEFVPSNPTQAETDDPPEKHADETEQQDELALMPCGHVYHEDCLVPWLKMHGTCPLCRTPLVKNNTPPADEEDPSGPILAPGSIPVESEDSSRTVQPNTQEEMRNVLRTAAEQRQRQADQGQQAIPGTWPPNLSQDDLD